MECATWPPKQINQRDQIEYSRRSKRQAAQSCSAVSMMTLMSLLISRDTCYTLQGDLDYVTLKFKV